MSEECTGTSPSTVTVSVSWDAGISAEFKRVLRATVSEQTYEACTGPRDFPRTFSALQMCLALIHVAGILGVVSLYPQQITCLLALFTGRHVFCLMQTGFGKTFAYEGLVLMYDFVYNGDHKSKTYARRFCPVLVVVNPLCSLMIEQTKAFNAMTASAALLMHAAQLSREALDPRTTQVRQRATNIAIVHSSVEVLVDNKQPYRDNIRQ